MLFLVPMFIVLLDQAVKSLLFRSAQQNTGIAFGLISRNHNYIVPIALGIGLIGSIYVYRESLNGHDRAVELAWLCIVGGIISNLIDRLRLGVVLDPLSIPYVPISFNLADVAIVIGFGIVLLRMQLKQKART